MLNKDWSVEDLATALSILGHAASVADARAQIARRLRKTVEGGNFRALFKRRGLKPPHEYLGSPKLAHLDATALADRLGGVAGVSAPAADGPPDVEPPTVRSAPSPGLMNAIRRKRELCGETEEPVDPLAKHRDSKELRRLRTENKRLIELVEEATAREAIRDALGIAPLPPIRRRELASGLREGTFCALLSDVHSEELVIPCASTKFNAYSLEICEQRLGRFFSGVRWQIEFKRPAFMIRDVVLWFGGDMMTGQIHEENVETGQLSPIETLVWLKPRLIAGIKQLLEDEKIETLYVVCSYGNHGRNTKKPMRARGAAHSYEWLMYQDLADHFKDERRVKFLATPEGHQYLGIYDWMTHWHHGDETSGGRGVGGIMIPLNKAVSDWNAIIRADFHNVGHFHQEIQTDELTVNNCLIGYNAYGKSIRARPSFAGQACYIIDSKRGKCERTTIWCVKRSEEDALRVARGWAPWPDSVWKRLKEAA